MKFIATVILAIILWMGLTLITAAILLPLWNMTMPQIFHLPEITYWQAYRLMFIACFLTKSSASSSYKPQD